MEPISLTMLLTSLAAGLGSAGVGLWQNKKQQEAAARGENIELAYTTTPEQRKLIEALGKLGTTGVQGAYQNIMGDPYAGFSDIQRNMQRGMQERGLPGLAESFTAMGQGAQRSSAFPQQRGELIGNYAQQLAQAQQAYGAQRLGQQQGFTNVLAAGSMQRPFEPIYKQQQESALAPLLGSLAGSLPYAARAGNDYYQRKVFENLPGRTY